jgi:hypothetical protein
MAGVSKNKSTLTLVNLDNILPNNATSANVEVSDLRVAHKPLLEPHGETVCLQLDKVVLVTDGVHVGGVAMMDGVALFVVGETPSVVNAKS